jgi:hypothetical protein
MLWLFARVRWHASDDWVFYNVPIAVPFVAFFYDRLLPRPESRRLIALDAAVMALALARVAVPPFPFVSGHALFAAFATGTARWWPLRATAACVLAQVIYAKTALGGGWRSMVAGLAVAAAFVALRTRWTKDAA